MLSCLLPLLVLAPRPLPPLPPPWRGGPRLGLGPSKLLLALNNPVPSKPLLLLAPLLLVARTTSDEAPRGAAATAGARCSCWHAPLRATGEHRASTQRPEGALGAKASCIVRERGGEAGWVHVPGRGRAATRPRRLLQSVARIVGAPGARALSADGDNAAAQHVPRCMGSFPAE